MKTVSPPPASALQKGRRRLLWLCLLLWGGMTEVCFAQSEDGIKAAFIYNFAKSIEWPPTSFLSSGAPITVGFIGASGLADNFERNTRGKNAKGHGFVVRKLAGAEGAADCQILYVADATQLKAVVAAVKGRASLILGEPEGLLASGGMIRFVREGTKVVFDVNRTALSGSNLRLDPKLLLAARTVKGG